ncbi:unnamed protein product [Caretta caretta]
MAMLSKPIKVEIGHLRKTHVFALLTLSDPKGQELGCLLVLMPECGMVTPAEGPEPDEYGLDTLIAKHAIYPELQTILRKHADVFAKHKQHDCGCKAVTIVVDEGDVQPKNNIPIQTRPNLT